MQEEKRFSCLSELTSQETECKTFVESIKNIFIGSSSRALDSGIDVHRKTCVKTKVRCPPSRVDGERNQHGASPFSDIGEAGFRDGQA